MFQACPARPEQMRGAAYDLLEQKGYAGTSMQGGARNANKVWAGLPAFAVTGPQPNRSARRDGILGNFTFSTYRHEA
jgi:hypothetical protein